MAEIKSPGNSEGQSEQREEGLQGEGIEKKKEAGFVSGREP